MMMKVLLISPRYSAGGAERSARDLFDRLPALGIQTGMLAAQRVANDPPGVRGIRLPGEKYLRLLEIFRKPIHRRYPGSVLALARVREWDVVHLHNLHGGWISIPAVSRLARRKPVVWTLHDEWAATGGVHYDVSRVIPPDELDRRFGTDYPFHPHTPLARRTRRFLDRWMPRPTALISPSRYIADLITASHLFDGVPIHLIPYGVEMLGAPEADLPRAQARLHFGIAPEAKVILMAAATLKSAYKGAWLAVEALRKLPADAATVLLLGDASREIAGQLPQRVIAPGFVADRGVLAKAFRAANLTLIASVADNFPYVALESLACKTPVVAFRVGGLPEIIGDNERGLLADPLDTTGLASNATRLLADDELNARLGGNGRCWVERHCRMDDFLSANVRIYQQCSERHAELGMR